MVEGVAHAALDDFCRLARQEPGLVLTLKFGFAQKNGDQSGAARHDVVAGHRARALCLADPLRVILKSAPKRRAKSCLMRAAIGRWNRVAVGMHKTIVEREPRQSPFERSVTSRFFDLARKNLIGNKLLALDILDEA